MWVSLDKRVVIDYNKILQIEHVKLWLSGFT